MTGPLERDRALSLDLLDLSTLSASLGGAAAFASVADTFSRTFLIGAAASGLKSSASEVTPEPLALGRRSSSLVDSSEDEEYEGERRRPDADLTEPAAGADVDWAPDRRRGAGDEDAVRFLVRDLACAEGSGKDGLTGDDRVSSSDSVSSIEERSLPLSPSPNGLKEVWSGATDVEAIGAEGGVPAISTVGARRRRGSGREV